MKVIADSKKQEVNKNSGILMGICLMENGFTIRLAAMDFCSLDF